MPSRFVPVGTRGRRASYSETPSSLESRASRPCWRYRWRVSLCGFVVWSSPIVPVWVAGRGLVVARAGPGGRYVASMVNTAAGPSAITAVSRRRHRWLRLVLGIALLALGGVLVLRPFASLAALVVLVVVG